MGLDASDELLVFNFVMSDFLFCSNEFSQMVAEEYLSYFNFSGLTVDQALRLEIIKLI